MIELTPIIEQSLQLIDEQLRLKHTRDLERLRILKHMDRDNIKTLLWRLLVLLNEEYEELKAITDAVKGVNKQLAFVQLSKESGYPHQVLHNILEGLLQKLLEVKGFIRQQQRICNNLTGEAKSLEDKEDELNSFSSKAFIQIISLMNKEIDASKNAIRHCDGVLPILNDLEATEKAESTLKLEGRKIVMPGHELIIPLLKAIIHKFVSQKEFLEKYDVEMRG